MVLVITHGANTHVTGLETYTYKHAHSELARPPFNTHTDLSFSPTHTQKQSNQRRTAENAELHHFLLIKAQTHSNRLSITHILNNTVLDAVITPSAY